MGTRKTTSSTRTSSTTPKTAAPDTGTTPAAAGTTPAGSTPAGSAPTGTTPADGTTTPATVAPPTKPLLPLLGDGKIIAEASTVLQETLAKVMPMLKDFANMLPPDIGDVFVGLVQKLDLNVSDLSGTFDVVVEEIMKALPPELRDKIQMILDGYNFLNERIQSGQVLPTEDELQQVAMAAAKQVFDVLMAEILELAKDVVDPKVIETIQTVYAQFKEIEDQLPTDPAQIPAFLSQHFLGVSPDDLSGLMNAPMASVDEVISFATTLDPSKLPVPRNATKTLKTAFDKSLGTLTNLEDMVRAAQTEGTAALVTALTQVDTTLAKVEDVLVKANGVIDSGYDTLIGAVDAIDLNAIVNRFTEALNAVVIPAPAFSIDGLMLQAAAALDGIDVSGGVEAVDAKLQALNGKLQSAFDSSPLPALREKVTDLLQKVEGAIAMIPTDQVNALIDQGVATVQQQMDKLRLNDLRTLIEEKLTDLKNFIVTNINDVMRDKIMSAVNSALSALDGVSLQALLDKIPINEFFMQIEMLVAKAQVELDKLVAKLKEVLSKLDKLSFKPIGNAVIRQIDGVSSKLRAINPNTLGAPEKMAIKAAVAVVENIPIDQMAADQVKKVYDMAEAEVKKILAQVGDVLKSVWEEIEKYGPSVILQPVKDAFTFVVDLIKKLNADILFDFIYEQVAKLEELLAQFNPENLLDPLQAPYDTMMTAINKFDPAAMLGPVQDLYDTVIGYIDMLNPEPLFRALEAKKAELFASIRQSALDALTPDAIPAPLGDVVLPIATGAVDAVFGEGELQRVPVKVLDLISPTKLFEVLDGFFDKLVELVRTAPIDGVLNVVNGVFDVINRITPQALYDQLIAARDLAMGYVPTRVLEVGLPLDLPQLTDGLNRFEMIELEIGVPADVQTSFAAVRSRLEGLIARIDPASPTGFVASLNTKFDGLIAALNAKIDALPIAGAQAAYTKVRDQITAYLPDFMRELKPLDMPAIIEGLQTLRPSVLGAPVKAALDRIVAQITPIQTTLEDGLNILLGGVRTIIGQLDPMGFEAPFQNIFNAIKAKIPNLDIGGILTKFKDVLLKPLVDLNPSNFKAPIGAIYDEVMAVLIGNVKGLIDVVRDAINKKLEEVQATLIGLVDRVSGILLQVEQLFNNVMAALKDAIFEQILARVNRVVDQLGVSFDQEVDRIINAFKGMLKAIPV